MKIPKWVDLKWQKKLTIEAANWLMKNVSCRAMTTKEILGE